jgi:DnaD/phage-associated family protein
MKGFTGFPDGPVRMTPIPGPFFTDLLPSIDHLGEMKITLYAIWMLARQEGQFRCLARSAMRRDQKLLEAIAPYGKERERFLEEAMERAVARGTLIAVHTEGTGEIHYFLNSPLGRAGAAALERGQWTPEEGAAPEGFWTERPNVFTLYEQNIGPLSPMVADMLREAERDYSEPWIEEAIRVAVEHNARSWKYIAAILERWKKEGFRGQKPSSDSDRKRYVEGEYADFIEH